MKKIVGCLLMLSFTATVFAQMSFSYDKTGNRIKAKLVITPIVDSKANDVINNNRDKSMFLEHTISIYPNPTSDAIYVDFKEATSYQIQLYDLSGKIITEETSTNLHKEIDVTTLQSAIYILAIKANGETIKWKVIKQ